MVGSILVAFKGLFDDPKQCIDIKMFHDESKTWKSDKPTRAIDVNEYGIIDPSNVFNIISANQQWPGRDVGDSQLPFVECSAAKNKQQLVRYVFELDLGSMMFIIPAVWVKNTQITADGGQTGAGNHIFIRDVVLSLMVAPPTCPGKIPPNPETGLNPQPNDCKAEDFMKATACGGSVPGPGGAITPEWTVLNPFSQNSAADHTSDCGSNKIVMGGPSAIKKDSKLVMTLKNLPPHYAVTVEYSATLYDQVLATKVKLHANGASVDNLIHLI